MPKISELHNPSTSYTVTGQEELIVNTTALSTIAMSASDLIGGTIDAATTGEIQNFKSTHTTLCANSGLFVKNNTNGTIDGRLTVGNSTTYTDNRLTVIGNLSATGTIYAAGSALGGAGGSGTPGGSDKQFQYNDSSAFGGAVMFYNETSDNVGIGVTGSNNIQEKLSVVGNISATGKLYNEDGEVGAVSPGGADGSVQFNNSGTLSGNAKLTFDDTNVRLGIGTATPAHPLTVHTSTGAANTPVAWLHNSGNVTAYDGTVISTVNDGSDVEVLHVRTNTTTYSGGDSLMLVRGDGNVGIGTDNPEAKLHVNAGTLAVSGANAALEVHNTTGNTLITFKSANDPSLELRANQTGFTFQNAATDVAILRLNENGNVGIGPLSAEPTKELSVLGAISASESIYGQGLSIDANVPQIILTDLDASGTPYAKFQASAGSLEIAADDGDELAGSTISMQVDNKVVATLSGGNATTSGSFGIGTAIPAYKLHVVETSSSTVAISAFGEIHAAGDIVSSSTSDRRQKTNIKKLDNALDKVLTLDGVEYDWNEMAAAHRVGKHDVGVIAQQVEEILPDAVEHRDDGMMAVRYERLVPLLIEAIKELKSEIDELKGK